MKKIVNLILKEYSFIFDEYPTLTRLPIYAWGRYYKYELAGDPFELEPQEDGRGFYDMVYSLSLNRTSKDFQEELLKDIDKKYIDEDSDQFTEFSLLDRKAIVRAFNFDERGGMCLILVKTKEGLKVETIHCDSPE